MVKSRTKIPQADPPSQELADQFTAIVHEAVTNFSGTSDKLESAIGFLYVGHYYGWKILYLIHSKRTVRQYEEILGINVRDIFPETGPYSDRSVAWTIAKKISNFWKVVSGEEKLPSDVNRLELSKPD